VAVAVGERDPVLRIPGADPQGDLHDQRGRVVELSAQEDDPEAERVTDE